MTNFARCSSLAIREGFAGLGDLSRVNKVGRDGTRLQTTTPRLRCSTSQPQQRLHARLYKVSSTGVIANFRPEMLDQKQTC